MASRGPEAALSTLVAHSIRLDLIVKFHYVFETRAAVYPDGTFEFAVFLENDPCNAPESQLKYSRHLGHRG